FTTENQCIADIDQVIRRDELLGAIVEQELVANLHRPQSVCAQRGGGHPTNGVGHGPAACRSCLTPGFRESLAMEEPGRTSPPKRAARALAAHRVELTAPQG